DHGSTDLPQRSVPTVKICSACGAEGPAESFPPKRSTCKPCRSAQNAEWRARRSEELREANRQWRAANADRLKAYRLENAERIARQARERHAANRDYRTAVRQEWRRRNRERDRENHRRWRAAHRAELLAREMERYWLTRTLADSVHLIEARIAYYGGKCWICRTADYEHLDHVKPLAKGGLHLPANLRPACAPCNIR